MAAKLTSLPATFSSLVRLEELVLSVLHHVDISPVNWLTGLSILCVELQGRTNLPGLDLSRHALRELQLLRWGREKLWYCSQMEFKYVKFGPTHVSPRAHWRRVCPWLLYFLTTSMQCRQGRRRGSAWLMCCSSWLE